MTYWVCFGCGVGIPEGQVHICPSDGKEHKPLRLAYEAMEAKRKKLGLFPGATVRPSNWPKLEDFGAEEAEEDGAID